jgi:PAS domain S-box-containing protein
VENFAEFGGPADTLTCRVSLLHNKVLASRSMTTPPPPEPSPPDVALFQNIIDTSDDGIAALDSGYRYVAFNRVYQLEFERMFGLRLEPGMHLEQALKDHPEALREATAQWARALSGEEFVVTPEIGSRQPQAHPYEIHFHCVRGAGEHPVYAFRRTRDLGRRVTLARLERERPEDYLQLAESAASAGVWHWDAASGRADGSREWRKLHGISPDRPPIALADLFATIHPEDTQRLGVAYERAAKEGSNLIAEFRSVHSDGSIHWLLTQGKLLRDADGKVQGLYGVTVDISGRKLYEQNLAEVTRRLEAHLANTPMAVVEYAPDFTIVRFSPEAERLFGWTAGEMVGKRLLEIPWIHDEDVPKVRRIVEDMASGRELKASGTHRNYRKDGRVVYCEWFNSALLDADGSLSSVLSFAADVTVRHMVESALRESEHKFRAIFELAAAGMARVSLDGRMLEVNRKFCELLGYTKEELLDETFMDLTHPEDREPNRRLFSKALAGEIEQYYLEKRYLHKNGSSVWTELTSALVRTAGGEPAYFISVIQDISARKAAEAALRRSNGDLKDFAYAAAHDLQEPVRTISMHTQLLSRRLASSLDPENETVVGYVIEGAARLEGLIRGLREYLDLADADRRTNEPVDLRIALAAAFRHLEPAARESGATLEVAERMPCVAGAEADFVRLFEHLISNSIQYASPGIPPSIRVSATRTGQEWKVTVTDNGIGVAREYQQRIFGVFKRLHGPRVPGSGIGLAICAKIVDRYGGRIWVDSEPGKGSAFSFTLPARRES